MKILLNCNFLHYFDVVHSLFTNLPFDKPLKNKKGKKDTIKHHFANLLSGFSR